VFTITVEAGFSATHRVRYPDGTVEEPHDHDWRVRAFFSRPQLDDVGMVIDFGEAQAALRSAVNEFENTDLNAHPTLCGANPTAEVVAKHLFDRVLAAGVTTLRRVEVTEAPGCVAIFECVNAVDADP
jgi:6-pyruvoyl-tetrahydropterin synthase